MRSSVKVRDDNLSEFWYRELHALSARRGPLEVIKPYREVSESAWLQAKVEQWETQHFSQLEKTCKSRGLRNQTSHLVAVPGKSIEQVPEAG